MEKEYLHTRTEEETEHSEMIVPYGDSEALVLVRSEGRSGASFYSLSGLLEGENLSIDRIPAGTVIPGKIVDYKFKRTEDGLDVSLVEPVTDPKEKRELESIVGKYGFSGRVDFW